MKYVKYFEALTNGHRRIPHLNKELTDAQKSIFPQIKDICYILPW